MADVPTKLEQILAALKIDDATPVETTDEFVAVARNPEPDEIGIKVGGGISFVFVSLDGTPGVPEVVPFVVKVNGTTILDYDGATPTWQNGWTGTLSHVATPYVHWLVDAEQVTPPIFGSEETVTINILFSGTPTDIEWDFVTEDIAAPTVLSADPIDQFTVRLTYSEPMAITGDGSALRVGAYTVERKNVFPDVGVTLEVVDVLAVDGSDDSKFDLVMQWEMTPKCKYDLTIDSSVTDRSGNAI